MIDTFPQTIARFDKAWKSGAMPHAWLFLGPKDIGKKALCFTLGGIIFGAGTVPSLEAGTYPDYIHFAKTSVHDFHLFKQRIRQTTLQGGWRVVMLSDVDTYNAHILNALLKILEEPPEKSVFLLTAEKSIMPTIASRCIIERLPPLPKAVFSERVGRGEALYALSAGYEKKAQYLSLEGIIDLVEKYWAYLDQATQAPIVVPQSFIKTILPYAPQWEEWTTLWFHTQFLTQEQVLSRNHLLEAITQRLQQMVVFHLDPHFVLQQIFAMLSVDFPRK